jgi:hypothetical protein
VDRELILKKNKTDFMKIFFATAFLVTIFSCSSPLKTVNFPTKQNENFTNDNLKNFLQKNNKRSIVLKVPNSADKVTSNTNFSTDNNLLYTTIEKELLKAGYSVRDRGLFNEIVLKSQSTDYSQIKDLTNTDLILEVVNIDTKILYTTNQLTLALKKGKTKEETTSKEYKATGVSAEFRLITVKNNEIAGTYKFFYKPCPNGCDLDNFYSKKKSNVAELEESVSSKTLTYEFFTKQCVADLLLELKKAQL